MANLIRALNHRMRRRILRVLKDSEEARSPIQLAHELHVPLSTVTYHINVLKAFGAVRKTGEQQVRGAIEHFYESTLEDVDEAIEELLAETRDADEDE